MDNKILEVFIPGPVGRLEAKYYKSKKTTSPVAIVLHPHPQYGGTMNNKIVQLMYNIFFLHCYLLTVQNFYRMAQEHDLILMWVVLLL